jgi:hypothetical protein
VSHRRDPGLAGKLRNPVAIVHFSRNEANKLLVYLCLQKQRNQFPHGGAAPLFSTVVGVGDRH